MSADEYPIDVETVRYELEQFEVRRIFSPEVLESIRLERYDDFITNGMVVELRGMVASWREQRWFKTPENWWEHLKERWFPAWALKRWPVVYRWYDAVVILPKVPVVKPEYRAVEFAVWRQSP